MAMRCATAMVVMGVAACGGDGPREAGPPNQGGFEIATSALSVEGVDAACYKVTVTYDDPAETEPVTLWTKENICSKSALDLDVFEDYGSGATGGILYVAPCVDDPTASPKANHVTIELTGIFDGEGAALTDWVPPPAFTTDALCTADHDTRVDASFNVIREAHQGFIDLKVRMNDVYCSAKVDCQSDLYYPAGTSPETSSGDTVVVALTCDSGDGTFTNLYADRIGLTCDGATVWIDPGWGLGTSGEDDGFVTGAMVFGGIDDQGTASYWNTAIAIDPSGRSHCEVTHLRMTGAPADPDFDFDDYGTYPVITLADSGTAPLVFVDGGVFGCENPLGNGVLAAVYEPGIDLVMSGAGTFDSCLTKDPANDVSVQSCDY